MSEKARAQQNCFNLSGKHRFGTTQTKRKKNKKGKNTRKKKTSLQPNSKEEPHEFMGPFGLKFKLECTRPKLNLRFQVAPKNASCVSVCNVEHVTPPIKYAGKNY